VSSGDGTDGDYYYYLGQIWVGFVVESFDQFCVCFFRKFTDIDDELPLDRPGGGLA